MGVPPQLPIELWEQILSTLARSYRIEERQHLLDLMRTSRVFAVTIRLILYETVVVSQHNVRRVCARIAQDADAFRRTRGLWMLDPVSPTHVKALSIAFAHVTSLGGTLYAFRSFGSESLRPRVVVLDDRIPTHDWSQLGPSVHPLLSDARHLHVGIALYGEELRRVLELNMLRVEVVFLDVFALPEHPCSPGPFIVFVRALLDLRTLTRLRITLSVPVMDKAPELRHRILALEDSRLTVAFEEVGFGRKKSSPRLIPRLLLNSADVYDVFGIGYV
ncbi:hypothetical protein EXIGLDRAFT_727634 [Exidia glandulosa HHB12029]|uniref:Uncharacterized protein n=1 Tax=Exidia glandulosa HHB12029 TaxID=1314781 RepID=A0A165LZI7_EXIGL|nr:hypothetical protein EXIGLDRAFT_727634 [Exidia glandulosa HHB12029]